MTDELKPCPFCGKPGLLTRSQSADWYGDWIVACSDPADTCLVNPWTVGGADDDGKARAIAAWNRRTEARDDR